MNFIIKLVSFRIITLVSILLLVIFMSVAFSQLAEASSEKPEDVLGIRYMDYTMQESRDPEANLPFLFAVYTIAWAGFFSYIFILSRRQHAINREIEYLKSKYAEIKSKS